MSDSTECDSKDTVLVDKPCNSLLIYDSLKSPHILTGGGSELLIIVLLRSNPVFFYTIQRVC